MADDSETDIVDETLEPNNFSIFNESLQQQVLKIHEATRAALPSFGDSSDSGSDDENNLILVRPQHNSSTVVSQEETHLKYSSSSLSLSSLSARTIPDDAEMEKQIPTSDISSHSFPEDSWKAVESQDLEECIEESFRMMVAKEHQERAEELAEMFNFDRDTQLSRELIDNNKVNECVVPLTGLNSNAFDNFLNDLQSAETTWDTSSSPKASSNINSSPKQNLTKPLLGNSQMNEPEGSAEMNWVLNYLEKNQSHQDNDEESLAELPESLKNFKLSDTRPPLPPMTETPVSTTTSTPTKEKKQNSSVSIAEQLLEISGPPSSISTSNHCTLYEIKKTQHDAEVRGKISPKHKKAAAKLKQQEQAAKGGKGGKGKGGYGADTVRSMEFSDDGSSDSDDDVNWRTRRAQAKQDRGTGGSTSIQDAWGGASLSSQQQRQRLLVSTVKAKNKKKKENLGPYSDLVLELLSNKPPDDDAAGEDDEVSYTPAPHNLANEEEEDDDDDDDEIKTAVQTYADAMQMTRFHNKAEDSEDSGVKQEVVVETPSNEKEEPEEDAAVFGFLSNLAKGCEDAMASLKDDEEAEGDEDVVDEGDDGKNIDKATSEENELHIEIASRNEKKLSDKMQKYEEEEEEEETVIDTIDDQKEKEGTSLSPTSASALKALELIRKAAVKSLSSIPKHRKVFSEIVPTSILDKPLRTLPMELWSDCYPCLPFDPNKLSSLSSSNLSIQSKIKSFNDKVRDISVLCIKEHDLTQSSLTCSFLAWLMKLNYHPHEASQFDPTLLSLQFTVASSIQSLQTDDELIPRKEKNDMKNASKKQKNKRNKTTSPVSTPSECVNECYLSLSEPQECSETAKPIFLFAISLPCEDHELKLENLTNFLKSSPIPLSYYSVIKPTPQNDSKLYSDGDDDVAVFHPLELFSRLPSFRSWQPTPLQDEEEDDDSDNDNETFNTDKDLFSNTSDVSVCILKSYLQEEEKEENLKMILSSLLCGNSTNGNNSSYLIGLRMIHLDHNQLYPSSAEHYLSFTTLEYLKSIEGTRHHQNNNSKNTEASNDVEAELPVKVLYVLAFRGGGQGCSAAERINQLLGPKDPILAKVTDPTSLRALYGKNHHLNLAVVPIGMTLYKEFSCWFGGRIYPNSVTNSSASSSSSTMSALASHDFGRLKPAPTIVLKKRETVMISFWKDHASRLGDIVKISATFGLSVCHIQLLTYQDIQSKLNQNIGQQQKNQDEKTNNKKNNKEQEFLDQCSDTISLQSLFEWLNHNQDISYDPKKRRTMCIWFESEIASNVVTNMLASSSITSSSSLHASASIHYDMQDCFSCLDVDKSLLSLLSNQLPITSALTKTMPKLSVLECSGTDFHRADKVSTDKSLPQTLVCVLPCSSNMGPSASLTVADLFQKLLKSNYEKTSTTSSSPSSSPTSSSSVSFEHILSDALPFELLGMKVFKKLTSVEANRIVSACSLSSTSQETISALTQTAVIILAIRCVEGRRKIKQLLHDEVEVHKHHLYAHMLPSLFVSKAPRSTLSLLTLFFPCYIKQSKLSVQQSQSKTKKKSNNRNKTTAVKIMEDNEKEIICSLHADENYPVPSRGLACLPPCSSVSSHHPLLDFFIAPELPVVSTITVISPKLCWLSDHHLVQSSNNKTVSHHSHKKPTVLIRVLKRIEKEHLVIQRLFLKDLSNNQWASVSEYQPSSTVSTVASEAPEEEVNEMAGLSMVLELRGEHAISTWADCVGPAESMIQYLSPSTPSSSSSSPTSSSSSLGRGMISSPRGSSHSSMFLNKSIDLDMHCLRGAVNMSSLSRNDLGVFAAQSYSDALVMSQHLVLDDDDSGVCVLDTHQGRKLVKVGVSMVETVCLVAVHELIQQNGLSALLESLVREEFDIVQLKVGCLTPEQADRLLSMSSASVLSKEVSQAELIQGPIAVVLVETENGINKLNGLIFEGHHQLTRASYSMSTSSYSHFNSSSHKNHNVSIIDDEDDVFKYTPPSTSSSSDTVFSKTGVICSSSVKEASEQIVFFFDQTFGVNQITSL